MYKSLAIAALISGASAFAPVQFGARTSTAVFFEFGEYDGKMWDNDAKKDVYAKWDPSQPRSTRNFNPFETFGGNTPDASGIYPGEMRYKDPIRPDVNFQTMMAERAEAEERAANPKPGDVPGAPGRKGNTAAAPAPQGAVMAPAPAAPAPAAYAPPPAAPPAPAAPAYTPPAPAAPANPMGGYVPGGFTPAAPAAAAPAAYTPPPAAPAAPAAAAPGYVDPNPAPMSDAQALEMGWSMGGQAHTKDPTPVVDSDPRKTIPQGESFEEYMKSRGGFGGAAAAPAPAAPAPVAPAPVAYTPPPPAPPAPSAMPYGAPAAPAAYTPPPAAYTPPPPPPPAAPAAPAPGYVDPNPAPMSDAQALEMGWSMGGQAHTKDPTPVVDSDPRKTIPQGESFEEYMKSRGM